MANDSLYSSALPFIGFVGEDSNQALFGGKPEGSHWGDSDNKREIEGTEFKIDRKYWELLGKPEFLFIGMGSEEGFMKWIGPTPKAKVAIWLEAVDGKD